MSSAVPFSDPLADGPTIQMTSYRALQNGVTVKKCLEVLSDLREHGVDAPMIFMGYYNPYLHYGLERFLDDAKASGLDGMIVPDLPTRRAAVMGQMAAERGIHLIPLLAPTSSDARIQDACKAAGGFIYCVSLTGVTGARRSLSGRPPDSWRVFAAIPISHPRGLACLDGSTWRRSASSPTAPSSRARSWTPWTGP